MAARCAVLTTVQGSVKQQDSLSDLIHLMADTQLAGHIKLTVCN